MVLTMLSGCNGEAWSFKPFDYAQSKDAAVEKKDSDYAFGIHGKRIYLKKALRAHGVPK